jgi:hypothetical protein
MVTTARATPSVDDAAAPTIARAGTIGSSTRLTIRQGKILIGAAITRHAHAAKRRAGLALPGIPC